MTQVTVKSLFLKSRQVSQDNFGTFWRAALVQFGVVLVRALLGSLFLQDAGGKVSDDLISRLGQGSIYIALSILDVALFFGILRISVKIASGELVEWTEIFRYLGKPENFAYLLLAVVPVVLVTVFGYVLFIIPGIYLSVCYTLVIPILIASEEDVEPRGIWDAMELSRRTVHSRWFTMYNWLFVKILLILSCLLIVPLYWVTPIFYATYGVEWAAFLKFKDVPLSFREYGTMQSDPESGVAST